MSEQVKNVFDCQARSFDDRFARHHFGVEGNALQEFLVVHSDEPPIGNFIPRLLV
jgi:hypothetical protein